MHVVGDLWQLRTPEGEELITSGRAAIELAAPLGRTPRKITFPDGTLFETEDHDGMGRLDGDNTGAALHRMEAFHPRLVAFIVAGIAAAWVIWRYGLDILVAVAVWMTPPVLVEQIDQGTLTAIDRTMAQPTKLDAETQARITDIFAQLVATLPEGDQDRGFTLYFRDTPRIGPNAFAMPGGTVVMTDQFVKQFGEDDIVAGVLGHELGHVVEDHGLSQFYRALSIFVLVAFIAGDTGPIIEDIVLEGNLILSLSFSRAAEAAADRFGVALSHEAGFDPAGLAEFFEKMSRNFQGESSWMSTHPSPIDRVQAINELIKALD